MKIVMIGPFAFRPKGTVSARAFPIARALRKHGYQVTILMPPYDNLKDSGRAWDQDGVRLVNMNLSRNDTWHQLTVPLSMARQATRLDPDLVHVFKPIGYSGLAGVALRWFSTCPVVLDTDDWEGTGGWSDVNAYPAVWKYLFDWQERWLARNAHAVTVVSRTLQTQVWGFGVDPVRVVYLPNGPASSAQRGARIGDEEKASIRAQLEVGDAPLGLYLGHIPHGSDLDLALDAFVQVQKRLPGARLVIAGVGDGLPRLQDHAERAGLAGCVIFPGWIEHELAPSYLAAADAIINPYRDTLINRSKCAGKVVMAMAMGKAVITSRVGENLEYIEDRRSGLLTRPGDVDDLAEALLSVLADRAWADELGSRAQQRIREKYDWNARVGDVERAYRIALLRSGKDA